ncbi:MAG: aminodeoxychorismate synthase component I [Burkholderiales bacterium]
MDTVFALLDDCQATPEHPTSRLYRGFVREHHCDDPAQLDAVCAAIDADLRGGLHAVLLADYEWGAHLLQVPQARPGGALRCLMFGTLERLSSAQAEAWLQARDHGPAGLLNLQADVGEAAFSQAVEQVQAAIRNGETYQVNLTHRLNGQAFGAPISLYRRLRARQPAPYGALIALPQHDWVLSCSPELFLRHDAGALTAQPMKGTAPHQPGQDDWLRHDPKNRAENLMIVDLLRNDLGRIAETGSVRVPALFDVQAHGAVWQMTSTVQARIVPGVGLAALLRATFPCGSITGAPKHRTMQWIQRLETSPRGLYTGAIGWLEAPRDGQACGDFCLSVAIRTLTLDPPDETGLRPTQLGVGAGIVLDSQPAAEWAECQLKARFATGLDPGFALFETLWASRGQGARLRDQHLARLGASAAALGFAFDAAATNALLDNTIGQLAAEEPHRLRLQLGHDGQVSCTAAALAPLPAGGDGVTGPVALVLAAAPVDPDATPALLLQHKTTLRQTYDEAVRAADAAGAFDALFFNAAGRLTEGGRSNVFVKLDGRWYTPPLHDGVLPGVKRAQVLADPAWQAAERSLSRDELQRAEGLMVCNALRGLLPARLQR